MKTKWSSSKLSRLVQVQSNAEVTEHDAGFGVGVVHGLWNLLESLFKRISILIDDAVGDQSIELCRNPIELIGLLL